MVFSVSGKCAPDEELDAIFSALADPTRRAIVATLREGDATVSELAEGFSIGMPAVSKHLTVLERAGMISRHRQAQWRHCRLERWAFDRMRVWVDHYTTLWTGSLDRLDDLLLDLQEDQ